MTYVVVESCMHCKHTDCVEVCPVEAFHEAETILYINPSSCIDCDACVSECPEDAIFADVDVPEQYREWIEINEREAPKYPIIAERKADLLAS